MNQASENLNIPEHETPVPATETTKLVAPTPSVRLKVISISVIGLPCALIPFLVSWYGYGSYMRYLWPFVLFAAAFMGMMCVRGIWYAVATVNLIRSSVRSKAQDVSMKVSLLLFGIFCAAFFVGWGTGFASREIHCRGICGRCNPVFAALEEYKTQHGAYPLKLDALPAFDTIQKTAGFSIGQGEYFSTGIDVEPTDDYDVVFYISSDAYLCLVPIEHRVFMSITRFNVYMRQSKDSIWRRDHIIWMWRGK
jgi:hypothetical protein